MANSQDELEILKAQVQSLTARVHNLEQRIAPQPPAANILVTTAETAPRPTPPPAPPPIPVATASTAPTFSLPTEIRPKPQSDLEGKIGRIWLNRVGIAAILFGAAYFLKYAFDNDLIGEKGRVAIGLLAGIAIVVWSESFRRRNYKAFSFSLKAVGIGILYLSFWAAAQYFHPALIPVEVAFVAMVVVTAATIVMALAQDAELLAFYALLGGFATPASLSTGQNREIVLFSYVLLLDLAVLAIAAFKPWRRLFWASFIGTQVLYIGWFSQYYSASQRLPTVVFTLLFGAIFATIPQVTPYENSRLYKGPSVTLTILPFINAATVFLCLFAMYENEKATLTWYALGLAAIYLILTNLFKSRTGASKAASAVVNLLHIAVAIAFITIAIPLKLDTKWITLGWLVESAVLLWIAVKARMAIVRILAGGTLTLAIVRLVFADSSQTVSRLLANSRFLTYLVAIAVLGGIVWAGRRYAFKQEMPLIKISAVVLNILALITLTLEAADHFTRIRGQIDTQADYTSIYRDIDLAQSFSFSAIWLIYGALLMAVGFWRKSAFVRWQALALIAFTIGKVFIWDTHELDRQYRILSFIGLGIVLLAISFVYQRGWLKLSTQPASKPPGASV